MISKTWHRSSTGQKALALLIPILVFRSFFLWKTGLIDDEAYHWTWSKELALSYFDHPAMIAWLESLSTPFFGDTSLGVRFPAFLCYLVTLFTTCKLARELFGEWPAYFVAVLILFTPLWGVAGYVASPEPPFVMFWALAAWTFWQGYREDGQAWTTRRTWLTLGVLMGLGLNSKFVMALLAPGFGLYVLMTPKRRRDLLTQWPWIGMLIATLLCAPIFVWNLQNDWPGFRYQFHDRQVGETFSAGRWGGWWAAQWLFMTPFAYVLILLAGAQSWIERRDPRWRFLFCLAVPSFAVFYPQPFFAEYKPHWPGPAYLLLSIGAGALWSQGLTWRDRQWVKPRSRVYAWGIAAFLVPLNLFVYSNFAGPWMPKAFRALKPGATWETTYDVSNEFFGWRELGEFALKRQREIHALTGKRPFIAALRYETTAQTWWGTQQKTYQMAFTRSHYTITQNRTEDFERMKGLDALVVTTEKYPAKPIEWGKFDSCAPEELRTFRGEEHSRTFTLWWCRNFQGVLK